MQTNFIHKQNCFQVKHAPWLVEHHYVKQEQETGEEVSILSKLKESSLTPQICAPDFLKILKQKKWKFVICVSGEYLFNH